MDKIDNPLKSTYETLVDLPVICVFIASIVACIWIVLYSVYKCVKKDKYD
jgi:predicted permease